MSTFIIHTNELSESGKDYSFTVEPSWLDSVMADADLRGVPGEPGQVRVTAHKIGDDVAVSGRVQASLIATCVRCLEDMRIDANVKLAFSVSPRSSAKELPEELELTPEDLDREFYDGVEVILDDIVRENLILEVPMKPLCSESCAGIEIPAHVRPPADFGVSDSQLETLQKLRQALPDAAPAPRKQE